jgi:hypothetical protein
MSIFRRTFMMVVAGLVIASGTEAFAKGPRVLLNATLTRTADAPLAAKGKAKFDQSASRTNFSAEAQGLNKLEGQVATILVNGSQVGTSKVTLGRVKLELTNQRGGTVPNVAAGTRVDIVVGTTRILSGSF